MDNAEHFWWNFIQPRGHPWVTERLLYLVVAGVTNIGFAMSWNGHIWQQPSYDRDSTLVKVATTLRISIASVYAICNFVNHAWQEIGIFTITVNFIGVFWHN